MTILTYERCDSLVDWTINAYFNGVINSSEQKECVGCLEINNLVDAVGDKYAYPDKLDSDNGFAYPVGNKVVGFWFKAKELDVAGPQESIVKIFLRKNNDWSQYIYVYVMWDVDDYYFHGAVQGTGGFDNQKFGAVVLDTWYWIELEWISTNSQKIWINGVSQHAWAGLNVELDTTQCDVFIAQQNLKSCGNCLFDIFEVTDVEGYLPAYPDCPYIYDGGPFLPFDEDKIHAKTESPKCVKPFNLPYARMSENLSVICKAAFDATYEPWEWWIDDSGELNFNERRGVDRSATIRFIAREVIPTDCDVHMGDTSKSIDSKRSAQRVKLTGKSSGKRQDEISSNWQLDEGTMVSAGTFYEEVISEKTVTGRETINDWARVHLQKLKDIVQEIEVTIERDPYVSGSWDVADDVWLYDPKSRITAGAYRIKRVNCRIDGGGEYLVLTVTNSWQDITDTIADIYRKIKQMQMTGMGVEDWTAGGTDQGKGQAQKMENLWSINKEYESANEFGEPKENDPNNSDSYWCNAGYPNIINGLDIRVRQDELTMEGSDTNNSGVQRITAIATRLRMTDWDESPRFHVRLILKSLDVEEVEVLEECMQSTLDWIKFGILNSQSGNPASLVMFKIECTNVGAQTYDVIAMANFNNSGLISRTVKEIVAGEMHEYEARIDWKSRYVLYYIDNLPVAVIPIDISCEALDIDDMELMYIRADMTSSEAYQPVLEFYTWKTQCEIVGKYDQSSS